MCQLMAMSANVPTDARFSFSGLVERGGGSDIHRDGWGIAFYRGRGVQEFRDPQPSVDSQVAALVKSQPIKSEVVISHIRQANVGEVCLENTHPFVRELWGRYWVFAHNGQLRGARRKLALGRFKPVGSTDSEWAFCWLLGQLENQFDGWPRSPKRLGEFVGYCAAQLDQLGVANFLLSDGRALYAHCSTRLHWLTRRAPFGVARLKDIEMEVDFSRETTPHDIVSVIATEPLTVDESWQQLASGDTIIALKGIVQTLGRGSSSSTGWSAHLLASQGRGVLD